MENKQNIIEKSRNNLASAVFWLIIFVLFMLVFTFIDLPFAKFIYHRFDLYSRIFQMIGLVPSCIAGIFFAISILRTREIAASKVLSVIVSLLSIFSFAGFTLLSVANLERTLLIPAAVFAVLLIPISISINRYMITHSISMLELRKVAIIALFATLMAVLGQTLIKFMFNRPRFIWLADPDAEFTYWFVHFPWTPDSSFPSGHAAQSALTFLLLYLKKFLPKLRTRKWDIALCAFAIFINGSTMLSRLFLGAHYLTDVWAGSFLTLCTISLSNLYVDRFYKNPGTT